MKLTSLVRRFAPAKEWLRRIAGLLALSSLVLVTGPGDVVAEQCDDDSIRSVTADGEIIVMLSEAVYRVFAGDAIDSALWLPVSDVLICERSIAIDGFGSAGRLT